MVHAMKQFQVIKAANLQYAKSQDNKNYQYKDRLAARPENHTQSLDLWLLRPSRLQ